MTEHQRRKEQIADRENTLSIEINDCMHYEITIDLSKQELCPIAHPFGQVYRGLEGGQVRYVIMLDGKILMFNKLEWLNHTNPFTRLTYPRSWRARKTIQKLV